MGCLSCSPNIEKDMEAKGENIFTSKSIFWYVIFTFLAVFVFFMPEKPKEVQKDILPSEQVKNNGKGSCVINGENGTLTFQPESKDENNTIFISKLNSKKFKGRYKNLGFNCTDEVYKDEFYTCNENIEFNNSKADVTLFGKSPKNIDQIETIITVFSNDEDKAKSIFRRYINDMIDFTVDSPSKIKQWVALQLEKEGEQHNKIKIGNLYFNYHSKSQYARFFTISVDDE